MAPARRKVGPSEGTLIALAQNRDRHPIITQHELQSDGTLPASQTRSGTGALSSGYWSTSRTRATVAGTRPSQGWSPPAHPIVGTRTPRAGLEAPERPPLGRR